MNSSTKPGIHRWTLAFLKKAASTREVEYAAAKAYTGRRMSRKICSVVALANGGLGGSSPSKSSSSSYTGSEAYSTIVAIDGASIRSPTKEVMKNRRRSHRCSPGGRSSSSPPSSSLECHSSDPCPPFLSSSDKGGPGASAVAASVAGPRALRGARPMWILPMLSDRPLSLDSSMSVSRKASIWFVALRFCAFLTLTTSVRSLCRTGQPSWRFQKRSSPTSALIELDRARPACAATPRGRPSRPSPGLSCRPDTACAPDRE
eukprot:scaffold8599_cov110-Isochrysis_galbana.AAC.5